MPRLAKEVETSRLTLEMASSVRKRLEHLRDRTEADSLAEVVRRALAIYDALWVEKEKGGRVILQDLNGTDRELLLV
jgi:hypothetical protein